MDDGMNLFVYILMFALPGIIGLFAALKNEADRKEYEKMRRDAQQKKEEDEKRTANDFEIRDGVLVKYHGHDECVCVPDGVTHIG